MASIEFQTNEVSTSAGYEHPKYMIISLSSTTNEDDGTSSISWALKAGPCSNAANGISFRYVQLKINDEVVYSKDGSATYKSDAVIASGTIENIKHNADGTKAVSVYAQASIYINSSTPNSTFSGTFTLDAILPKGVIYISDGTKWDAYQIYIDDGTKWVQYIPYIDDGTNWVICS